MGRHRAKHGKSVPTRRPMPRWVWIAGVSAVCAFVILLALGRFAAAGGFQGRQGPAESARAQPVVTAVSTAPVDPGPTPVEVPTLTGLKLDEAKLVLTAAGLTPTVRRDPAGRSKEPTVTSQDPPPGTLARPGAVITIVVPAARDKDADDEDVVDRGEFVVCIDPGHQSHSDSKTEPIGPGSAVVKSRITGGTTGVVTGVPEYETVLQIATNLKRRLEAAGVTVVMTRSTNDGNLSNAERAQIANAAHADLFVRVHADSSTDEKLCGVSTLYPSVNDWTKKTAEESKRAASVIQPAVVKSTRAVNIGMAERGDLAGFNWSTVPCVLVSVGFPSNRVEDRLLVSPNYQDQVAQGLAAGTLEFLSGERR